MTTTTMQKEAVRQKEKNDGCTGQPHTCGAPLQHRLFRWRHEHPAAPLKDAAKELHTTPGAAWKTWHKLVHRPDFARLCPFCFSPSRGEDGYCHTCGAEFSGHLRVGVGVGGVKPDFESQSPVHRLLPGKGNGTYLSRADYRMLARAQVGEAEWGTLTPDERKTLINNLAAAMRQGDGHDGEEDDVVKEIKSRVLQALKEKCPADHVSDEAATMIVNEVAAFRAHYPILPRNLGWFRDSLTRIVLSRLELEYPRLKGLATATATACADNNGRRTKKKLLPPHQEDLTTLPPGIQNGPAEEENGYRPRSETDTDGDGGD